MKMADANFTVGKEIQKPQPYRIGEGFEEVDGFIQGVGSLFLHPHSRI